MSDICVLCLEGFRIQQHKEDIQKQLHYKKGQNTVLSQGIISNFLGEVKINQTLEQWKDFDLWNWVEGQVSAEKCQGLNCVPQKDMLKF